MYKAGSMSIAGSPQIQLQGSNMRPRRSSRGQEMRGRKRRREACSQLGRAFSNLGITRQRRIPLGTIRWHDDPEDVEFHAP
ncbi:hypothetical protein CR513_44867, partial [Mucuna pruriens]